MCIGYTYILEFIINHTGGVPEANVDDLAYDVAASLKVELTTADIQVLLRILHGFKGKWKAVSRNKARFICKYTDWLDQTFCRLDPICLPSSAGEKNNKKGRRSLPFPDMSHRNKLRVTEGLRQEVSSETLVFAAASNLQKDGRRSSA